jgi:hypothetical protein
MTDTQQTKEDREMREQQEILDRIEEIKDRDFFGIERSDLLDYLDFENAKEFLKDDVTEKDWNDEGKSENSKEAIIKVMKDYMSFAIGKAEGERGISAGRSLAHYTAWIWLAEDNYGRGELKEICEHYGWDYSELEEAA